jgi:hypothetical protein
MSCSATLSPTSPQQHAEANSALSEAVTQPLRQHEQILTGKALHSRRCLHPFGARRALPALYEEERLCRFPVGVSIWRFWP